MKIFKFSYLIRLILILFIFFIFFLSGAYAHKYNLIGFLKVNIIKLPDVLSKVFYAQKSKYSSTTPKLLINLNDNDLKMLLEKRKNILEFKTNETITETFNDNGQFFPANIKYNDINYNAKITLGGKQHFLENDKIPFRIKLKGDKKIFNVNKFVLQHPKVRNYIFEWLFHEAHKYEGGLFIHYDFAEVILNNEDLGIYAVEESFGKNLLKKNNRKNSPIIKFDMSINRKSKQYNKGVEFDLASNRFNEIVMWQEEKDYINDDEFNENFLIAAKKLNNFENGNLKTSQVFDVNKMAMYVALCDLFQGQHALHKGNLMFYYNPDSSLLEPISFETNSMDNRFDLAIETSKKNKAQNLIKEMFEEDKFVLEYVRYLKKFSSKEYLNKFLSKISSKINDKYNFLNLEYSYHTEDYKKIFFNQKFINVSINPIKGLNAFLKKTNERNLALLLGSVQYFPVELKFILIDGKKIPLKFDTLNGLDESGKVSYKEFSMKIPKDIELTKDFEKNIEIGYKIIGLDKLYTEKVNFKNYINNN
jgi:hypothetical protein